jgi:hypothetical protein
MVWSPFQLEMQEPSDRIILQLPAPPIIYTKKEKICFHELHYTYIIHPFLFSSLPHYSDFAVMVYNFSAAVHDLDPFPKHPL